MSEYRVRHQSSCCGRSCARASTAPSQYWLVRADSRLGWHQECHAYFYDAQAIENKLTPMRVAIQ